jgi:DNA-binding transcriptional regulator of glucitol operon
MSACDIALLVIYFIAILLVSVCAMARFSSLFSRWKYRNELYTYPNACGAWAVENGCTRISLFKD